MTDTPQLAEQASTGAIDPIEPIVDASDHVAVGRYLEPLIGCEYEIGAMGPKTFDCWGITRKVQQDLFGRFMPKISVHDASVRNLIRMVKDHPLMQLWRQVDSPTHGCLVQMSHSVHPHHIGTYLDLDGGGVFHTQAGPGVSFETIPSMVVCGWRRFYYYDWIG